MLGSSGRHARLWMQSFVCRSGTFGTRSIALLCETLPTFQLPKPDDLALSECTPTSTMDVAVLTTTV